MPNTMIVMKLAIRLSLLTAATLATSAQSFTQAFMDKTVDPCSDFYQYACGTWRAQNPVPSDYSRWGRFEELLDRNQKILREILEAAAKASSRTPTEQKIGDYYAACMDEGAIEKKGLDPLKAELNRIEALKSARDLAPLIARLHQLGAGSLFGFGRNGIVDLDGFQQLTAGAFGGDLTGLAKLLQDERQGHDFDHFSGDFQRRDRDARPTRAGRGFRCGRRSDGNLNRILGQNKAAEAPVPTLT